MNRSLAAACVLLVATACGTAPSVSHGQAGALPVKEWCAQYREIITSTGLDLGPPTVGGPEFLSMLEKLKGLAEKAPAEIRDDLRAMWTTPQDLLNSAVPTGPQATPENPEQLPEQAMRPFRWINDNCGDEAPFTGPSGADAIPADFPENRPVGDWQAVQRGTVGPSTWTFFRTGASDGGICVATVVPDLGPGSHVVCAPLSNHGLPPGTPDFLSMACNGSTTMSVPPVPPAGQPKG